jgi:hypothetical protein
VGSPRRRLADLALLRRSSAPAKSDERSRVESLAVLFALDRDDIRLGANGRKAAAPAQHTTASIGLTFSKSPAIESASSMSTLMPSRRVARITSCRPLSAVTSAFPIAPVAPITTTFMTPPPEGRALRSKH